MTYIAGGNILAADYNTFSTLAGSMNEVLADLYSGATSLPTAAYGYGRTPALTSVVAGTAITAAQWAELFEAMRDCGTHQGTVVVPPVPSVDPASGDVIESFNSPSTLASVVALLNTNRHNLAVGQTTVIAGTSYAGVSTWTNELIYSFQVDFSSWNNARYFFNTGGSIQINGSYPGAATPVEIAWSNAISSPTSPFTFNWNSTDAATGSNDAPLYPIGFWKESTNDPLTTSYQILYRKAIGGAYVATSFVQIEAKLAAVAGTNGLVDFRIRLIDGDVTPDLKAAGVTFQINNAVSVGTVPYSGPAVIITNGGFTYA